jgi:RNA polymerase sigma-70 factor (ECF subfamily)
VYPPGSLIAELESARRKLLDVFQVPDTKATEERRTQGMGEVKVLYELEGLSYKELAATMGIPVGTVMSRLSRARRRLQKGSEYRT